MAERPLENLMEDLTLLADDQVGQQVNANSLKDSPQGQPHGHAHPVEGHDAKRTKLIQQQLVLLLHANKCLQREGENPSHVCNLHYCRIMKDVLKHMVQCKESNNCKCYLFCGMEDHIRLIVLHTVYSTDSHCVSSRQIIMHWKLCGSRNCSICTPLKGVSAPNPPPDGLLAAGPKGGDAWQSSIKQNFRDHLIRRMLQGIYPVQNFEAMRQNMQYMKLVAYFKKIEEDFFNSCRSKEEYFSKLAEKYRDVQAEISRPRPDKPPVVQAGDQHHQQPPMMQDQTNSEPVEPDNEMYIG